MTFEIVVAVYGVFMSLAPFLQARRMHQLRSSADVSIVYQVVLLGGFALYLGYGISIGNWVLILTNCVSIAATTITLAIAAVYRPAMSSTQVTPKRSSNMP